MRKILLIVALTTFCLISIAGCSKTASFDAQNFAKVEESGLNGKGTIQITIDNEKYSDNFDQNLKENYEIDKASAIGNVIFSLNYEIMSDKKDGFSNGDEIQVKATFNEDMAESQKVKFTNTEFTYIVSGLKEGQLVDPFAEIELTYEGISPFAKVRVFNRSEEQFIRDIGYDIEPSSKLRIGDKIVVTAKINLEYAEEQGYLVPDELTKEFTVENIDEYVKNFDDIDSATKATLLENSLDIIKGKVFPENAFGPRSTLGFHYQAKLNEPKLVKIYFEALKPGVTSYNSESHDLYYVYEVSTVATENSPSKIGYAVARFNDIVKHPNGSTSMEYYGGYGSEYKDLDLLYINYVTKNKAEYDITEIDP